MRHLLSSMTSAVFIVTALSVSSAGSDQSRLGRTPSSDGFQQIIPRGRIASIDNPEFTHADEAIIPSDAWILGFEMNGQAFAYDLNLLNAHEVVNHQVGATPVAAVW